MSKLASFVSECCEPLSPETRRDRFRSRQVSLSSSPPGGLSLTKGLLRRCTPPSLLIQTRTEVVRFHVPDTQLVGEARGGCPPFGGWVICIDRRPTPFPSLSTGQRLRRREIGMSSLFRPGASQQSRKRRQAVDRVRSHTRQLLDFQTNPPRSSQKRRRIRPGSSTRRRRKIRQTSARGGTSE